MWTIENSAMQPLLEADSEGEALALLMRLADPRLPIAERAHCARCNETRRVHTAARVRDAFLSSPRRA